MMLLTATIVLSLIALSALLLAPWSSRGEYDRDAINQALYRDRLRELTADVANEQERAQLVEELQHTLLQDIPGGAKAQQRPLNRWVLLRAYYCWLSSASACFGRRLRLIGCRSYSRSLR